MKVTLRPGFSLVQLYLRAIPKHKPLVLIKKYSKGLIIEVLLRFELGQLMFGGAYIQRALFSEFYGTYFSKERITVSRLVCVSWIHGNERNEINCKELLRKLYHYSGVSCSGYWLLSSVSFLFIFSIIFFRRL